MAHSYKYLCKKAGIPPPTGFAKIDPAPKPTRVPVAGYKPLKFTPDAINHTALTFMACCKAGTIPGHYLQTAILTYLAALRDGLPKT